MGLKLDQIQFSSGLPNYINIGTPTQNVNISGNILNLAQANFTTTIVVLTQNTRCDIYAENTTTGNKQLISTSNYLSNDISPGGGVYQHISTETVQMSTSQISGLVTVTFTITNLTGATITLVTQTLAISVVEYQIPF